VALITGAELVRSTRDLDALQKDSKVRPQDCKFTRGPEGGAIRKWDVVQG
jgi:hypothetical protein